MSVFEKILRRRPASTLRDEPIYAAPLREGDFEGAVVPLREAIKYEDPVAMTAYAAMLAVGRGMEQDFEEAALWFRQAAVRGDVNGQLAIGACLATGLGTPRNDDEAAFWLYQAGKRNNLAAIDLLSTLVWRDQALIGRHFSKTEFHQLLKKAHRPGEAALH
ncbi:MAG: tetratricopeptide repeat protein [Sterolibacterium sp.]|jgi:TPR repeat protein